MKTMSGNVNSPRTEPGAAGGRRRELRQFGFAIAVGLVVMFGLMLPWMGRHAFPLWPWITGMVCATTALAAPRLLAPLQAGWTRVTTLIGAILTPLVVALIFFAVVTPLALLRRALGHDPLSQRLDDGAPTYRVPARPAKSADL